MRKMFATALVVILPGCSLTEYAIDLPEESTLAALAGKEKTQQQFASEKLACEQKARHMASKARDGKAIKDVGSVGGGMALGSMLGAITGGGLGVPGGTALGAATGASAGAVVGVAGRAIDTSTPQGAFDLAFWKCMREAGNTLERPESTYAASDINK
jgi:hypothetical protein